MSQYESNTDFMYRIMSYSPHGALVHAFVIEALMQYSAAVADPSVEVPDSGLVSGQSWKNTAKWIQTQLEQHLSQ